MTNHIPTAVRRSLFPQEADTWTCIAERELGDAGDDNVVLLQSWNMHVFARAAAPAGSPRAGNPILPSDVIFLEPPASH
ncbi:MAG: hypothetical protein ACI9SB_002565 [Candidatus Azotimanducaceae bacterium]|jgi:hypothetical protein